MPTLSPEIIHSPEPPVWLADWLSKTELLGRFPNQTMKNMAYHALQAMNPRRLTWNDKGLYAVFGSQAVKWKYQNGNWQTQCSCGYPGECLHAFALAMLFGEVCQREKWQASTNRQDFFQSVPSPQPAQGPVQPAQPAANAGDSRPPLPASLQTRDRVIPGTAQTAARSSSFGDDLFSWQQQQPKRQVRLEVEADFKHEEGQVGIRCYAVENNVRSLVSFNNIIYYYQDIVVRKEKNIREWSEFDQRFIRWYGGKIKTEIPARLWNLQMHTITDQEFAAWREHWSEVPGRFIDRCTQKAILPPGQTVPVRQFAQLHAVDNNQIRIDLGFIFPNQSRQLIHQILQKIQDNPDDGVTRHELRQYKPPVDWPILTKYFARKSPTMPRSAICEYLGQLLGNRLDVLEDNELVKVHRQGTSDVVLDCRERDGRFHLRCLLDGSPANLNSDELSLGKSSIIEEQNIFHVYLRECGEDARKLHWLLREFGEKHGTLLDQEEQLTATAENAKLLRDFCLKLPSGIRRTAAPALTALLSKKPEQFTAGIKVRDDRGLVTCGLQWQLAGCPVSETDIKSAIRNNTKILHLANGSWFAIDPKQAAQALASLKDQELSFNHTVTLAKRDAQKTLKRLLADNKFAISQSTRNFASQLLTESLPDLPPVPEKLRNILRPYQIQGYDFLNDRLQSGLGLILADDMGLGKTLQILTVLENRRLEAQQKRQPFSALVVCPATVIGTWLEQAQHFTPELKVQALTGTQKQRQNILDGGKYQLLVTHYGLMRNDCDKLLEHEFDFLILDEAQNIKNPEAQVTCAAKKLQGKNHLALTGTPLENRPLDLWSIMDFLNPGYLGNAQDFIVHYECDGDFSSLKNRLRPLLLRRTKSLVAPDLPPRTVEVLYTELTPEQQKLYDQVLAQVRSKQLTGAGAPVEILAALTRLRQICCDPALLPQGQGADLPSGKTAMLLEKLEELVESGHSVLVFSAFATMLQILQETLLEHNLNPRLITGQTPVEQRARLVQEFSNDPKPGVFLLSLKAAGTGLTLTKADYVFNFDPWWNPAAENQAIDRTHRLGQTKPVTAYKLIAKNTIEERVLDLMNRKQAIFQAVVGDDDNATIPSRLTREDLLELLR